MQSKKQPRPKGTSVPMVASKGQGPRRPVGMQALGPIRYEQLRRALHLLGGTTKR